MKKIFVIGAGSVFAKDVVSTLSKDHDLVTGGRKDCDVYCDITKSVEIPKDTEVVINFASAFDEKTDQDIKTILNTNVEGLLNICTAANAVQVKHVINISSASALLDKSSPYYSMYSITKRQADEIAEYYCKINEIPLTILMPTQLYGDSDDYSKHQQLFYLILDKAQAGENIPIYGTHDSLRNYIHSEDVISVISSVIGKRLEGTYLCSYDENVTYSQIAKLAQEEFGRGGKVVFLKDKPDIPDNVFSYKSLIFDKLGYKPKISLKEGILRIKKYRESNK